MANCEQPSRYHDHNWWLRPSVCPRLSGDQVHVWCGSLELPIDDLAGFLSLLSPDEQQRAKRFYFERDRNHFIAGRGLLRAILSVYLRREPSRLKFDYGAHGKPAMKAELGDQDLQFNLAHSNGLALIALSLHRCVGIDLEYIHAIPHLDHIVEQFFSAHENAYIRSLSGDQKQDAFFKIWTCKEAFSKAKGNGLNSQIKLVEVSLGPDGSTRLSSVGGDTIQAGCWHLETFIPLSRYQAALAVQGHDCQIIFHHLNDLKRLPG